MPQPAQPAQPSAGGTPPDSPVRAAFRRALRDMLVLVGLLTAVGTAVGWWIAGSPGVWGALLGVAVALMFSGSTVLAMLLTADRSITAASAALVGTWLVKTLVLIIAFSVLRETDFFDRQVFGVVVIAAVLGSVLLDYRAVAGARVPYVEPGRGTGG